MNQHHVYEGSTRDLYNPVIPDLERNSRGGKRIWGSVKPCPHCGKLLMTNGKKLFCTTCNHEEVVKFGSHNK